MLIYSQIYGIIESIEKLPFEKGDTMKRTHFLIVTLLLILSLLLASCSKSEEKAPPLEDEAYATSDDLDVVNKDDGKSEIEESEESADDVWLKDYYKDSKYYLSLLEDETQYGSLKEHAFSQMLNKTVAENRLERNNIDFAEVKCVDRGLINGKSYITVILNADDFDKSTWRNADYDKAIDEMVKYFYSHYSPDGALSYSLRVFLKPEEGPSVFAVDYFNEYDKSWEGVEAISPEQESEVEKTAREILGSHGLKFDYVYCIDGHLRIYVERETKPLERVVPELYFSLKESGLDRFMKSIYLYTRNEQKNTFTDKYGFFYTYNDDFSQYPEMTEDAVRLNFESSVKKYEALFQEVLETDFVYHEGYVEIVLREKEDKNTEKEFLEICENLSAPFTATLLNAKGEEVYFKAADKEQNFWAVWQGAKYYVHINGGPAPFPPLGECSY